MQKTASWMDLQQFQTMCAGSFCPGFGPDCTCRNVLGTENEPPFVSSMARHVKSLSFQLSAFRSAPAVTTRSPSPLPSKTRNPRRPHNHPRRAFEPEWRRQTQIRASRASGCPRGSNPMAHDRDHGESDSEMWRVCVGGVTASRLATR